MPFKVVHTRELLKIAAYNPGVCIVCRFKIAKQ